MRLGQAAMEALRAEITGCLQPGDELAVVCPVGLKGTSIIAEQKKERLAEQFSAGFIYNCRTLFRDYGAGETVSVKDITVWKMAQEAGVSALYEGRRLVKCTVENGRGVTGGADCGFS